MTKTLVHNLCPICDEPTSVKDFPLIGCVVLHLNCYEKIANNDMLMMRCDRCGIPKPSWYEEEGGKVLCNPCREELMDRINKMDEEQKHTYLNEK